MKASIQTGTKPVKHIKHPDNTPETTQENFNAFTLNMEVTTEDTRVSYVVTEPLTGFTYSAQYGNGYSVPQALQFINTAFLNHLNKWKPEEEDYYTSDGWTMT